MRSDSSRGKRFRRLAASGVVAIVAMVIPSEAAKARQSAALVPDAVSPRSTVVDAIVAEWLTPAERSALRIRHGTWSPKDLESTPDATAQAAMGAGRWDLVADDSRASLAMRATAMVRLGRGLDALALLETATPDVAAAPRMMVARARALHALGRLDEAVIEADLAIAAAAKAVPTMAGELAAVEALRIRLAAGGGAPDDFERMLDRLSAARNGLDRLDPDPRLIEGLLLLERGNAAEGVPTLHETLGHDPRRAEAWHALGRLAAMTFDFDGAERAADALDRIAATMNGDGRHPLATLIRARGALVQNDPDLAAELLDDLLQRHPTLPDALALRAGVAAVRYDTGDESEWLTRLEQVEPGSGRGYLEVGGALSFDRQYEAAAKALSEAIRRGPHLAEPQVELGLLEMQAARDDRAMAALQAAVALDPYHKRAAFSLFLLEELDTFEEVESANFILRYRPGLDEVVASGMLGPLESMHADLAERFRHAPDRKTVIELMPDHQFFAVRITGMPAIHTIAACTGPLIAIEVPRVGSPQKHLGIFDWLRVLRHEYAHTITLSQTRNRIPHWLTEAAAVSIEGVPRTYGTCGELAGRWRKGDLFDLDEINFAFVRPKRPGDRSMAYAQGAWMVEFMNERWGDQALVDLMALYFEGVQEKDAIPEALGVERDEFHAAFLEWAGIQIAGWGLDPQPSLDELGDLVRDRDPSQSRALEVARRERLARISAMVAGGIGEPATTSERSDPQDRSRFRAEDWPGLKRPPVEIDDDDLVMLLEENPAHPDLLELVIRRQLRDEAPMDDRMVDLLDRYAAARPVDPHPHRILARHHLDAGQGDEAIAHLIELDLRSDKDPTFALEIARQARRSGEPSLAFEAAERAARMNAYDPATRELAAACAIEARRLEDARRHIVALGLLEPEQPRHAKRLQAVDRLLSGG
ncbi:MAG: hypothetical protein CMJ23_01670 [Phycisphaerae bacterium]|nr:hypothetical protein [Phycisphaerae bacterium]